MKQGRIFFHFIHKTNFFWWIHTIACTAVFSTPALLCGCSSSASDEEPDEEHTVIKFNTPESGIRPDEYADIFIFNDDSLKRLDSYQKTRMAGGEKCTVASRCGEKIMVALANVRTGEWRNIHSYEGILSETILLSLDNPELPAMTGITRIRAGSREEYELEMTRVMSEIRISGLRTDFFGTEYEGESLEDVKLYLTNVSAVCPVSRTENLHPELIVNFGRLDELSLTAFNHKEMLLVEVGDIGRRTSGPFSLFCYPSDHSEETAGSPYTKLVIEGSIKGHTYYYPLTINRKGQLGTNSEFSGPASERGCGIRRNRIYDYDITICRSGTDDPDIPVSGNMVILKGKILDWEEKENETIYF